MGNNYYIDNANGVPHMKGLDFHTNGFVIDHKQVNRPVNGFWDTDESEFDCLVRCAVREIEQLAGENNVVLAEYIGCHPEFGDAYRIASEEGASSQYMFDFEQIMAACIKRPVNITFTK